MREMEINRIKRILDKKDTDCNIHCANLAVAEERAKDLEEELELKSGENNRLRKQCADVETAIKDLYISRKGQGTQ